MPIKIQIVNIPSYMCLLYRKRTGSVYAFVKGGREMEKGEVPDTDITAEAIKSFLSLNLWIFKVISRIFQTTVWFLKR